MNDTIYKKYQNLMQAVRILDRTNNPSDDDYIAFVYAAHRAMKSGDGLNWREITAAVKEARDPTTSNNNNIIPTKEVLSPIIDNKIR
jgi:hypothetical protein